MVRFFRDTCRLGGATGNSYYFRVDQVLKQHLCRMRFRIATHIGFWLLFTGIYALMSAFFAGPSDLVYSPAIRLIRFWLSELAVLPCIILPYYAIVYYLIPRYFNRRAYVQFGVLSFIIILLGLLGYRFMVPEISEIMYQERPEYFTYSLGRLFYTFTEMLPAFGLAASAKLLKNHFANQKRQTSLEKEKLASELNFLKAQTNPHFLFNTLNNLYGLARKQDEHTAPSILKLSNIMRFILYECSAPRIPIYKEIKIIEDYIALESLRYDERLVVQFDVQMDDEHQSIAPLLILPFIENAFKHGASEVRSSIEIKIDLALSAGQLWLAVKNTRDQDDEAVEAGIGLKNVQRQLELTYPDHYQLSIDAEPEHFNIELMIQLNAYAAK